MKVIYFKNLKNGDVIAVNTNGATIVVNEFNKTIFNPSNYFLFTTLEDLNKQIKSRNNLKYIDSKTFSDTMEKTYFNILNITYNVAVKKSFCFKTNVKANKFNFSRIWKKNTRTISKQRK